MPKLKKKKEYDQYKLASIRASEGNISLSEGSVSSVLKKLVDEGVLKRKKGIGSRGGFGYKLR